MSVTKFKSSQIESQDPSQTPVTSVVAQAVKESGLAPTYVSHGPSFYGGPPPIATASGAASESPSTVKPAGSVNTPERAIHLMMSNASGSFESGFSAGTQGPQPTPLYPEVDLTKASQMSASQGTPQHGTTQGAPATSVASSAPEGATSSAQAVNKAPGAMPQAGHELKPRITVVGVGGAGCNAVNNMITSSLQGVQFVVCNTDAQALSYSLTDRRIQLGTQITQGLGAGSKPTIGHAAAEESLQDIIKEISGSNMVFITAGMGGGTGTGAAPVVAQAARELGILTVAVATKPFHFEGNHRMKVAEQGIEELAQYVDTLIVIPNQNLFRIATEKTGFMEAFKLADNVLHSGVRGVTDLMMMPGLINLDFADVRSVMSGQGKAMMGTGEATGEGRSIAAAEAAISNPLLDDVSMKGAQGILINITGGMDMTLFEVDEAANRIRDEVDPDANIIFGSTFDEGLEGVMRVSVVATGIEAEESRRRYVRYQQEKEAQTYTGSARLGAAAGQNQENVAPLNLVSGTAGASESQGNALGGEPGASFEDHFAGLNLAPGDQVLFSEDCAASAQLQDLESSKGSKFQDRALMDKEMIAPSKPKKKGFFSRFAGTLRRGRSSEEENDRSEAQEAFHVRYDSHAEATESIVKSKKAETGSGMRERAGLAPQSVVPEDENVQDIPAYLRRKSR